MPLISCKNVRLAYENTTVISDLNFEVNSGDYLCIVGENGSGKSTLMKALLGLKSVSEGTISFDASLKRNEIGYLPQQTVVQKDFPASVFEVVLSGMLMHERRFFYGAESKKRARSIMARLGIDHIADKSYRELSGGQQQRILLARALCASEKLIILDEPVSGLDPKVTNEFYDLISEINRRGVTVIMVSHDISGAVKYASHVLHISKTPLFFGKKSEYTQSVYSKLLSNNQ